VSLGLLLDFELDGGLMLSDELNGSLPTAVADELRALIVRGTLLPGEHLGQSQLADRFGRSKVPIREAPAARDRGLPAARSKSRIFRRAAGTGRSAPALQAAPLAGNTTAHDGGMAGCGQDRGIARTV
jgi:DNA-binding FadR family transcriptional regulator